MHQIASNFKLAGSVMFCPWWYSPGSCGVWNHSCSFSFVSYLSILVRDVPRRHWIK
uniref:Uncharacterized protein n=1 Tax=Arundo donax TaxID=35708 RepID=A0A0A9DY53_ARUDO